MVVVDAATSGGGELPAKGTIEGCGGARGSAIMGGDASSMPAVEERGGGVATDGTHGNSISRWKTWCSCPSSLAMRHPHASGRIGNDVLAVSLS